MTYMPPNVMGYWIEDMLRRREIRMALPLNEVPKKEVKASKPGNIFDEYVKTQDINNALARCKEDIIKATEDTISEKFLERNVFPFMDKWLQIKKK